MNSIEKGVFMISFIALLMTACSSSNQTTPVGSENGNAAEYENQILAYRIQRADGSEETQTAASGRGIHVLRTDTVTLLSTPEGAVAYWMKTSSTLLNTPPEELEYTNSNSVTLTPTDLATETSVRVYLCAAQSFCQRVPMHFCVFHIDD